MKKKRYKKNRDVSIKEYQKWKKYLNIDTAEVKK